MRKKPNQKLNEKQLDRGDWWATAQGTGHDLATKQEQLLIY